MTCQCNCTSLDKEDTLKKIDILRSELIQIGMKEGLQSVRTLEISQVLDRCLNQYQSK